MTLSQDTQQAYKHTHEYTADRAQQEFVPLRLTSTHLLKLHQLLGHVKNLLFKVLVLSLQLLVLHLFHTLVKHVMA